MDRYISQSIFVLADLPTTKDEFHRAARLACTIHTSQTGCFSEQGRPLVETERRAPQSGTLPGMFESSKAVALWRTVGNRQRMATCSDFSPRNKWMKYCATEVGEVDKARTQRSKES